ncbi:unnamed protein product [Durusdinium trenchii]|uniref:PH domain-containing protein n=1 Tax=Durusdinium trenchii TaxID=1381693 RepID=A0ABP0RYY1_9DINO
MAKVKGSLALSSSERSWKAEARLSVPPAQAEIARWIPLAPAGVLARWRTENMILVQGFLLFLDFNSPLQVLHALSLSSIISVNIDDGQALVPCLSIKFIIGGRQEVIRLRFSDPPTARSWLRRFEVAKDTTKFTQTYLPLASLSQTLEAWQLCSASTCAIADSQRQQDWKALCSYGRSMAVRSWLRRRVSSRLHDFLHRACRLSDRRGTSVVLSSLGALHLGRALHRWRHRWMVQGLRALERRDRGCPTVKLCRWQRDFMKSLLHCWFRAVGSTPVQGGQAALRRLSWEIPLATAAFYAWSRALAAVALNRKQADLDVQLEENLRLLQDCQELPAEMALRRMVRAVSKAQSRLKVHAYLALREKDARQTSACAGWSDCLNRTFLSI